MTQKINPLFIKTDSNPEGSVLSITAAGAAWVSASSALDSATISDIITNDVDSAYVQARETPQDFAYSSLTGTPNILDSTNVSSIVSADVDKTFVDALNVDADTLDGENGSYYLDYTNVTNKPNILDSGNIVNIVDSAYVQARQNSNFATESYVTSAIDNLVNAAPSTLDTLNELAAALGDDANFSTTITNTIATKLAITAFDGKFDSALANKTTDDITEGSNLYYTSTRVEGVVDSAYINARVDAGSSLIGVTDTSGDLATSLGSGATSGSQSTAVGYNAKASATQNVAIGYGSGNANPSSYYAYNVGIGHNALFYGDHGVVVGQAATTSTYGTAMGFSANAAVYGVAIGANTSANNGTIAIGYSTEPTATNMIVLNATNSAFNPTTASSFFVNPIRSADSNITYALYYNATTKEVTYTTAATGGGVDSAAIAELIDSSYVQLRQTPQDFSYTSLTDLPDFVDSNDVTLIVDSDYIQARQIVGGGGLDSAAVSALIDSATVTGSVASAQLYEFTADSGDTFFSGIDDNSNTLAYSANNILVHRNGILLVSTVDYNATNGTSLSLTSAADSGDTISITAYKPTLIKGSENVLETSFEIADSGQTVFDIPHEVNQILVFLNGILLKDSADYASNGTDITLTSAADSGDEITVHNLSKYLLSDASITAIVDSDYVAARAGGGGGGAGAATVYALSTLFNHS